MMWRASIASSRTVILLPGSGSPLELAKVDCVKPELAGALGHHLGEGALVAGDALRQHDAGIVAALEIGAVQEIVDRDLAVEGGEHGRAARQTAGVRQACSLTVNVSSSFSRP